jgi:hypothetical protein
MYFFSAVPAKEKYEAQVKEGMGGTKLAIKVGVTQFPIQSPPIATLLQTKCQDVLGNDWSTA